MAADFRRATPDPGLGASIELRRGNSGSLFNLVRIGKTLPGQGIASEEPPPALLQIEPACPCRNEDLMQARVLREPGAGLGTVVAGEIVSDDENVPVGIVGFDVLEQLNVVRGVA